MSTPTQASQTMGLVVALVVGAIVASFLVPIGLDQLALADTSMLSMEATSIWNLWDVVIVISLLLFFVAIAINASR